MTDLFLGDDSYHGGAFMLSAGFGFYAPFFHPQQNPVPPKPEVPFDFGTPDSYKFYLQAGNVANLDKYFEGSNLAVGRPVQARHLRRLLAVARPVAAHEEREVRGACGGRLV